MEKYIFFACFIGIHCGSKSHLFYFCARNSQADFVEQYHWYEQTT